MTVLGDLMNQEELAEHLFGIAAARAAAEGRHLGDGADYDLRTMSWDAAGVLLMEGRGAGQNSGDNEMVFRSTEGGHMRQGLARFLLALTFACSAAQIHAQTVSKLSTTVEASCTGSTSSKLALKWDHPNYDSGFPYFPTWQVKCDGQMHPQQFDLTDQKSQLEIQTEGGVQTGYSVTATIAGAPPNDASSITLNHSSTPTFSVNDARVSLKRTSGPNRYGEQNFRVTLANGSTPNVKISIAAVNASRKGQVALKWGHPDFGKNSYFPTWTVHSTKNSGVAPETHPAFGLRELNSQFEIQTEGGEDTRYTIAMFFDFGEGFPTIPTIAIDFSSDRGDMPIITGGNDSFATTTGNVYGERTVRVLAPNLPDGANAPSGLYGTVTACNLGEGNQLSLSASLYKALDASATGATSMTETIPLNFPVSASGTVTAQFQTQTTYERGTWSVKTAQVLGANNKAVAVISVPGYVTLPGPLVLDFTGSTNDQCPQ